ncbi:hypothetical protein L1887_00787 [Cichorium endivia]|nr:hypothetical protein L1887_00787 [Cichorium endivia]
MFIVLSCYLQDVCSHTSSVNPNCEIQFMIHLKFLSLAMVSIRRHPQQSNLISPPLTATNNHRFCHQLQRSPKSVRIRACCMKSIRFD